MRAATRYTECSAGGFFMNILSAIYSGQTGFLKATDSMADRAKRLSELSENSEVEQTAQDVMGLKLDSITAKANLQTVKVADNVLSELTNAKFQK